MAKKKVKKKPAKGGTLDKIVKHATGKTTKKKAVKRNPNAPEKERPTDMPSRRSRQQDLIPDVFPDRIDRLEELAAAWVRIADQKKKAAEKIKAIKDQVSLVLIDEGLTEYKCYTVRKALERNVDAVKVRTVPEKEATPYQPN